MKTIYVVSHTESEHHLTNLVGGWYDSELTDKGIFDAEALAQTISSDSNVDTVISSDLKRNHRAQSH